MPEQKLYPVALALGANLNDRLAALRKALEELRPYLDIHALSHVYETPAAYVTNQPAFLNAALYGMTKLEPLALLWTVKDIESAIGREPTYRYGPRAIDIDILFHGDRTEHLPELILPHPRLHERDFVLRPLGEVAPHWRHPQSGKTAPAMLAALPETGMTDLGALL